MTLPRTLGVVGRLQELANASRALLHLICHSVTNSLRPQHERPSIDMYQRSVDTCHSLYARLIIAPFRSFTTASVPTSTDTFRPDEGIVMYSDSNVFKALAQHEDEAIEVLGRPLQERTMFGFIAWWHGFDRAIQYERDIESGAFRIGRH